MRKVCYPFLALAYYATWFWFGLGGVLLNFVCAILLCVPGRQRFAARTRTVIRHMFDWWLKWGHASKVLRIHWVGLDQPLHEPGTIYIANHPALLDAPVVLARLVDTVCIFKPALLTNPIIGPAAILAGYASGGDGLDTIREAVDKISAGRSLLIFPEGTRTAPGEKLGPLKPGFALIAQRAGAPIRFIHLRTSRHLTTRGRAWWKLPELPCWIEVTLGERIPGDTTLSCTEITALAEKLLTERAEPVAPIA